MRNAEESMSLYTLLRNSKTVYDHQSRFHLDFKYLQYNEMND